MEIALVAVVRIVQFIVVFMKAEIEFLPFFFFHIEMCFGGNKTAGAAFPVVHDFEIVDIKFLGKIEIHAASADDALHAFAPDAASGGIMSYSASNWRVESAELNIITSIIDKEGSKLPRWS